MLRFALTILCWCFVLTGMPFVFANDPHREDEAETKSGMEYNVSVNVVEKGNRTLIASVRDHRIVVDQPREFGADNLGPTPPELLAVSFGTCIVSTLQLIALRENLDVRDISVTVEGTVDFSRAMGVSDANRAGFSGLTATIDFTSSLDDAARKALVERMAAIGAALDNIENATPVQYTLK